MSRPRRLRSSRSSSTEVAHGGDAHERSDIDIIVFTHGPKDALGALEGLAHEASLGTGRSPDIRILSRKDLKGADEGFRANLRAEGLTVFSNDPKAPFLEDAR